MDFSLSGFPEITVSLDSPTRNSQSGLGIRIAENCFFKNTDVGTPSVPGGSGLIGLG